MMACQVVCYPESLREGAQLTEDPGTTGRKSNEIGTRKSGIEKKKTCAWHMAMATRSCRDGYVMKLKKKSRCQSKHHNGISTSRPWSCQSLPSVADLGLVGATTVHKRRKIFLGGGAWPGRGGRKPIEFGNARMTKSIFAQG